MQKHRHVVRKRHAFAGHANIAARELDSVRDGVVGNNLVKRPRFACRRFYFDRHNPVCGLDDKLDLAVIVPEVPYRKAIPLKHSSDEILIYAALYVALEIAG